MTRYLSIPVSILALTVFATTPTVNAANQPELTKKEKRIIKSIARKIAKKQINKTLPLGPDELATGAVTTPKLATEAVTTSKIESGAVGTSEIADGAVKGKDLDPSLVTKPFLGTYELVDANGKVIGPMLDGETVMLTLTESNMISGAEANLPVGTAVKVQVYQYGFTPGLYYSGDNCTGEVLMMPHYPLIPEIHFGLAPGLNISTGYTLDHSVTPTTRTAESYYGFNEAGQPSCLDENSTRMWGLGITQMIDSAATNLFVVRNVRSF